MTGRPEPTSRKTLLRFRIASAGEPIFRARARIGEVARYLGFNHDQVDEILLAFSEALSNAIIHGCREDRARVYVKAVQDAGRLVIEISDHGSGFHPNRVTLPPSDSMQEGGRGLFLMRAFMDEVQWFASPEGTTVRLTRRCPCGTGDQGPSPLASLPAPTV